MAGNSLGNLFRITTFGESHGPLMGVVIDGCPSGIKVDLKFIQDQLDKRRPGQSKITTQRKEQDSVEFVSGVFNGLTTGTPITALVKNVDARSTDYKHLEDNYRPSHADYTYDVKYGFRDHRGGGRASARETVSRVIAGSLAKLILKKYKIEIYAYVSSVGPIHLTKSYQNLDLRKTFSNIVRCPDDVTAKKMITLIEGVKKQGDTVGGIVTCVIQGVPPGVGEPVFDKLHSDLGKAMLSINAVKGFEIGSGFSGCEMRGSEHNDIFKLKKGKIVTETNFSGGVQGGISNGMDIYFRVAFKPVATILKPQTSINRQGKSVTLEGRGRHDPCVVPRAVPVVESMAALVMADHILRMNSSKL